jgi:hypothetical protein
MCGIRRRRRILAASCALGVVSVLAVTGTLAPNRASAAQLRRAPTAAAAGNIGLRLIDGQAAAPNDPRAGVYIVDHLAPGTVIRRHVEISNTTTALQHVALYPAAAAITNGSFVGATDRTPNELSSWITVAPRELDIPPGGHRTATVTVAVTRGAAPGERYGVVWAEVRSAPTPGGGIIQVSRVGVRVYLSVGPGGAPAAGFAIESVVATRPPHGRPVVTATVRNTGGRALDMAGTLELLDGPGGLTAGPFPANLGTTLGIGGTGTVVVGLDKRLPAGPWKSELTLRSGFVEHTARTTLQFPNAPAALPPRTERAGWFYAAIAALALLLVGLVGALVIPRTRRRRPNRRGAHALRPAASSSAIAAPHLAQRPGRRSRGGRRRARGVAPRHRARNR